MNSVFASEPSERLQAVRPSAATIGQERDSNGEPFPLHAQRLHPGTLPAPQRFFLKTYSVTRNGIGILQRLAGVLSEFVNEYARRSLPDGQDALHAAGAIVS